MSKIIKSEQDIKLYGCITLPHNNVRILAIQEKIGVDVPKAAIAVGFGDCGSINDTHNFQGMAHMSEHVLFMGSERYPVENELDGHFSKYGGYTNAFTANQATVYIGEIDGTMNGALEKGIDMVASFCHRPLVRSDSVRREIKAVQNEYVQGGNNDAFRLEQVTSHSSLRGHPHRTFGMGSQYSLLGSSVVRGGGVDGPLSSTDSSITDESDPAELLAEEIKKFHSSNYTRLENVQVVVRGNGVFLSRFKEFKDMPENSGKTDEEVGLQVLLDSVQNSFSMLENSSPVVIPSSVSSPPDESLRRLPVPGGQLGFAETMVLLRAFYSTLGSRVGNSPLELLETYRNVSSPFVSARLGTGSDRKVPEQLVNRAIPSPLLHLYRPIKSNHTISLSFAVPPLLASNGVSCALLGSLVGHEVEGSPLYVLKKMGYALKIQAGFASTGGELSKYCDLFQVQVGCTTAGMRRWREVITVIFSFIVHVVCGGVNVGAELAGLDSVGDSSSELKFYWNQVFLRESGVSSPFKPGSTAASPSSDMKYTLELEKEVNRVQLMGGRSISVTTLNALTARIASLYELQFQLAQDNRQSFHLSDPPDPVDQVESLAYSMAIHNTKDANILVEEAGVIGSPLVDVPSPTTSGVSNLGTGDVVEDMRNAERYHGACPALTAFMAAHLHPANCRIDLASPLFASSSSGSDLNETLEEEEEGGYDEEGEDDDGDDDDEVTSDGSEEEESDMQLDPLIQLDKDESMAERVKANNIICDDSEHKSCACKAHSSTSSSEQQCVCVSADSITQHHVPVPTPPALIDPKPHFQAITEVDLLHQSPYVLLPSEYASMEAFKEPWYGIPYKRAALATETLLSWLQVPEPATIAALVGSHLRTVKDLLAEHDTRSTHSHSHSHRRNSLSEVDEAPMAIVSPLCSFTFPTPTMRSPRAPNAKSPRKAHSSANNASSSTSSAEISTSSFILSLPSRNPFTPSELRKLMKTSVDEHAMRAVICRFKKQKDTEDSDLREVTLPSAGVWPYDPMPFSPLSGDIFIVPTSRDTTSATDKIVKELEVVNSYFKCGIDVIQKRTKFEYPFDDHFDVENDEILLDGTSFEPVTENQTPFDVTESNLESESMMEKNKKRLFPKSEVHNALLISRLSHAPASHLPESQVLLSITLPVLTSPPSISVEYISNLLGLSTNSSNGKIVVDDTSARRLLELYVGSSTGASTSITTGRQQEVNFVALYVCLLTLHLKLSLDAIAPSIYFAESANLTVNVRPKERGFDVELSGAGGGARLLPLLRTVLGVLLLDPLYCTVGTPSTNGNKNVAQYPGRDTFVALLEATTHSSINSNIVQNTEAALCTSRITEPAPADAGALLLNRVAVLERSLAAAHAGTIVDFEGYRQRTPDVVESKKIHHHHEYPVSEEAVHRGIHSSDKVDEDVFFDYELLVKSVIVPNYFFFDKSHTSTSSSSSGEIQDYSLASLFFCCPGRPIVLDLLTSGNISIADAETLRDSANELFLQRILRDIPSSGGRLNESAAKNLSIHLPPVVVPPRYFSLPPRGTVRSMKIAARNTSSQNSVTSWRFFFRRTNFSGALCRLLDSILSEPVFNELRTKRQLGYHVGISGNRKERAPVGVINLSITSSGFEPHHVFGEMHAFLRTFWTNGRHKLCTCSLDSDAQSNPEDESESEIEYDIIDNLTPNDWTVRICPLDTAIMALINELKANRSGQSLASTCFSELKDLDGDFGHCYTTCSILEKFITSEESGPRKLPHAHVWAVFSALFLQDYKSQRNSGGPFTFENILPEEDHFNYQKAHSMLGVDVPNKDLECAINGVFGSVQATVEGPKCTWLEKK